MRLEALARASPERVAIRHLRRPIHFILVQVLLRHAASRQLHKFRDRLHFHQNFVAAAPNQIDYGFACQIVHALSVDFNQAIAWKQPRAVARRRPRLRENHWPRDGNEQRLRTVQHDGLPQAKSEVLRRRLPSRNRQLSRRRQLNQLDGRQWKTNVVEFLNARPTVKALRLANGTKRERWRGE